MWTHLKCSSAAHSASRPLADAHLHLSGLLLSISFQPHSSFHVLFAFCQLHCISLCRSPPPRVSLAVSACSVCQRYHRCIRLQTQTQQGQKTTFATKEALVASWSRQQQKAGALDNQRVLRTPFAAKMAAVVLPSCLSPTHVQAHSRLFSKQGRDSPVDGNVCPVWAYMLSTAPNCNDKYEMVALGDKGSRKLSSTEAGRDTNVQYKRVVSHRAVGHQNESLCKM